jgi:hypothetical protein
MLNNRVVLVEKILEKWTNYDGPFDIILME